jgi:hypothetical protein
MRWLLALPLITGLALASSAGAQRGGSAGHAGGFSAPHSFAPSAPRMSGGFGSAGHFSSAPSFPARSFSAPRYNWSGPAGTMGSAHYPSGSDGHHHNSPYPSYGYRSAYRPYYYANSTYLAPGLLNSYIGYPDSYSSQDDGTNNQQAQTSQDGNYGPEAAPNEGEPGTTYQSQDVPPPPPDATAEPVSQAQASVTLVFKDGHSQQVQNYALTKTTLYVLDDAATGRRPAIPLDTIDVAATERTNQAAGVDFVIPTAAN